MSDKCDANALGYPIYFNLSIKDVYYSYCVYGIYHDNILYVHVLNNIFAALYNLLYYL